MTPDFHIATAYPDPDLNSYVESFWSIENHSSISRQSTLLPDGEYNLIFRKTANGNIQVFFRGLETTFKETSIPPNFQFYAVSFRLLAIEYLFKTKVPELLNGGIELETGYWGITLDDLADLPSFHQKATAMIRELLSSPVDSRKQRLFEALYNSGGNMKVAELAATAYWSSRQINRYFTQYFGLSLKAYCRILRFRRSLGHIKKGQLFPENNFTDQTHFIKDIKQFSGVVPGELARNENGRFLLLSALPPR